MTKIKIHNETIFFKMKVRVKLSHISTFQFLRAETTTHALKARINEHPDKTTADATKRSKFIQTKHLQEKLPLSHRKSAYE